MILTCIISHIVLNIDEIFVTERYTILMIPEIVKASYKNT